MGRTHEEILAGLPKARREKIDARAAVLTREVESLKALRRFVEAAGGTLELRVELPGKGVLQLTGLGDAER